MDVRHGSFPAGQAFFDQFSHQFGDDEDDWEDEEDGDEYNDDGQQPECTPQ